MSDPSTPTFSKAGPESRALQDHDYARPPNRSIHGNIHPLMPVLQPMVAKPLTYQGRLLTAKQFDEEYRALWNMRCTKEEIRAYLAMRPKWRMRQTFIPVRMRGQLAQEAPTSTVQESRLVKETPNAFNQEMMSRPLGHTKHVQLQCRTSPDDLESALRLPVNGDRILDRGSARYLANRFKTTTELVKHRLCELRFEKRRADYMNAHLRNTQCPSSEMADFEKESYKLFLDGEVSQIGEKDRDTILSSPIKENDEFFEMGYHTEVIRHLRERQRQNLLGTMPVLEYEPMVQDTLDPVDRGQSRAPTPVQPLELSETHVSSKNRVADVEENEGTIPVRNQLAQAAPTVQDPEPAEKTPNALNQEMMSRPLGHTKHVQLQCRTSPDDLENALRLPVNGDRILDRGSATYLANRFQTTTEMVMRRFYELRFEKRRADYMNAYLRNTQCPSSEMADFEKEFYKLFLDGEVSQIGEKDRGTILSLPIKENDEFFVMGYHTEVIRHLRERQRQNLMGTMPVLEYEPMVQDALDRVQSRAPTPVQPLELPQTQASPKNRVADVEDEKTIGAQNKEKPKRGRPRKQKKEAWASDDDDFCNPPRARPTRACKTASKGPPRKSARHTTSGISYAEQSEVDFEVDDMSADDAPESDIQKTSGIEQTLSPSLPISVASTQRAESENALNPGSSSSSLVQSVPPPPPIMSGSTVVLSASPTPRLERDFSPPPDSLVLVKEECEDVEYENTMLEDVKNVPVLPPVGIKPKEVQAPSLAPRVSRGIQPFESLDDPRRVDIRKVRREHVSLTYPCRQWSPETVRLFIDTFLDGPRNAVLAAKLRDESFNGARFDYLSDKEKNRRTAKNKYEYERNEVFIIKTHLDRLKKV